MQVESLPKKEKRGDLYEIIEKIKDNAEDSLNEIKNHNEKQLRRLDTDFLIFMKSPLPVKTIRQIRIMWLPMDRNK